jgi:uncharacterized membrane protein YcaP (DUF421 family)
MDKSQIKPGDMYRILIGNAPVIFTLEVLIRTLLTWAFLIVIIRLLGKRMSGQVTITELGVMLLLGAIMAGPVEIPEKGILIGWATFLLVFIAQWLISRLSVKSRRMELIMQGRLNILAREGVLDLRQMSSSLISRDQLFAFLRSKNIYNLGQVKRIYFEASGLFSVYTYPGKKPGLTILPPGDPDIQQILQPQESMHACCSCGYTEAVKGHDKCIHCGADNWTQAVS